MGLPSARSGSGSTTAEAAGVTAGADAEVAGCGSTLAVVTADAGAGGAMGAETGAETAAESEAEAGDAGGLPTALAAVGGFAAHLEPPGP